MYFDLECNACANGGAVYFIPSSTLFRSGDVPQKKIDYNQHYLILSVCMQGNDFSIIRSGVI